MTLIARWDNGVKREFKNLDKLNAIINKAELDIWCEMNNFKKPMYEIVKDK